MTESRRDWLTTAEAVKLTGRSKRTIRRWIGAELVATWRPDMLVLINRVDLLRVEGEMAAKIANPAFGTEHAEQSG